MIAETEASPAAESEAMPASSALEAEVAPDTGELPETHETPDTADTAEATGSDTETGSAEDDLVEVEFEGVKVKVPPAFKDAFMRTGDYTRKTMEVAREREALKARAAEVERQSALTVEEVRAYGEVSQLQAQVEGYEGVDWDVLEANDPSLAAASWRKYQAALQRRDQLANALRAHEAEKSRAAAESSARLREEATAAAAKEIRGWSSDRQTELESFARDNGFDPADIASVNDYRLLDLALEGKRFRERQAQAARLKAQSAAAPAAVAGTVTGAGPTDPAKMTTEQFIAWRRNHTM